MTKHSIHEHAAKGFEVSSDAYDRGRPEYPEDAVDFLVQALALNSDSIVVDLAAGTGKFTKQLLKSGAKILAVEPVVGMRKKFSSLLPNIEILNGTAEQMPMKDASVDSIVVAQAFHWFRGEDALREFHRILKPQGRLGMIWNARDEEISWVGKLTEIIDPHEKGAPRYKTGEWKKAFKATPLFTPLEYRKFGYNQSGNVETIVDRVASISFIASLPESEKIKVLEDVRKVVEVEARSRNLTEIVLPYRTDVFTCKKLVNR